MLHESSDYPKWVINQFSSEVNDKHKTSVNNLSEESQGSLATDLKRHLLKVQSCKFEKH